MNIIVKAIKGIQWTAFSSLVCTVLQIVQLAILARVLSPADFGMIAIVMVVVGFSQIFQDVGISNAIIQKQDITLTQLSTLYWLNILTGLVLFLLIHLFIASIVGEYYGDEKLCSLVSLMSLTFIIQPFGQQFFVILRKEMRFREISRIEIVNKLIVFITTITFAYKGFGVYSIVIGYIFGVFAYTIQYLTIGFQEHRPLLRFNFNEVREFLNFGMYQIGEKSINYLGANIDRILIGKYLGVEILGFYNLAWQLIMFPLTKVNPILNQVSFPLYSKVQEDLQKLFKYFKESLRGVSLINLPILVFMMFFSNEIIEVFYGKGWQLSADLLSILCFAGLFKAINNPGGSVLLALGRVDIGFWWNLVLTSVISLTIFNILYFNKDIIFLSYVLSLISFLSTIVWHTIIKKLLDVEYGIVVKILFQILLVSSLLSLLVYVLLGFVHFEKVLYKLLFSVSIFSILYGHFLIKYNSDILGVIVIKSKISD